MVNMKDYNIIYNKHKINGLSFDSEIVPVLWPVLAYNIVLQARKPSKLNIFEKSVLGICNIKMSNHEILSDVLCIPIGFIKIIVQSLKDKGLLNNFKLTNEGKKLLEEIQSIEVENQNAVIFRDCLSGKFLPHIEKKLIIYNKKSKNNNEITFLVNNKPITGFEIRFPKKKYSLPTINEIYDVIKLSNILAKEDLRDKGVEKVLYLEDSSINICKYDSQLVYLYTEVCKSSDNSNDMIWVTDPFHNTDCDILQKDFINGNTSEYLEEIAKKIQGQNLTTNLEDYNDNPDSKIIIDSYKNLNFLLRPLYDDNKDIKLIDNKLIERIVDFQNALEQSFMLYLKKYDIEPRVKSLASLRNPDKICELFNELAFNKVGFSKIWNIETKPKIEKDSNSSDLICKYSENFFRISGGHFNNILRNEGNLKELFALALALHQKESLPEINKLVKEFPDLPCFLSYINSNKNYGLHGENIFFLPTEDQLEECRQLTIKIISILLNQNNLEEDAEKAEGLDIPLEKYRDLSKKANYELQKVFGYGRLQRLPENIRNSLCDLKLHCLLKKDVKMAFYYIQRSLDATFGYVLRIVLNNKNYNISDINGKIVLEKIKQKFPNLPPEFTSIKESKISSTLRGGKESLRANLLCLMALSDSLKFLDKEPSYIQTIKKILEIRTHNFVDSLKNVEQNGIYGLENDVIGIINLLLKEHYL